MVGPAPHGTTHAQHPRSYAQATATTPTAPPVGATTTVTPASTNAQPAQRTAPQQRPGAVPHGPPPQVGHTDPVTTPPPAPQNQDDWTSNEPFPPQQTSHGTRNQISNGTPTNTVEEPPRPSAAPTRIPNPPISSLPQAAGRDKQPPNGSNTTQQQTNRPASVTTRSMIIDTPPTTSHQPKENGPLSNNETQQTLSTKQTQAHPAPSRSNSDISQWQQPKRQRTRKAGQTPQPPTDQQIQKSNSRTRKPKASNKFAVLEYVIHPSFSDDDVAPIEIALPVKPTKPPRRKFKDTKTALTTQVCNSFVHPQEVRHPAHTLTHLSPSQIQVVLKSTNNKAKAGRDRLLKQLALMRVVRTKRTHRNITLDQTPDNTFLSHIQMRLAECSDPPDCNIATPVDLPLRAILGRDELRVRGAIAFAWMDLATRAVLPHLYDLWPDPPSWNGRTLQWLDANDGEVPCLRDEALAALAACPTLHAIWQQFSTPTSELTSAILTVANQWNLLLASQKRN